MASLTAISIINRAELLLTDANNIRWGQQELLDWLNDGQRAIVAVRPDANPVYATVALLAGTRQSLPATAYRLIDVARNTAGASVLPIAMGVMDQQDRGWHTAAQSGDIRNFIYDDRDPKRFYVYPPAIVDTEVDIVYSKSPDDITITNFTTATDTIEIDDVYANALVSYILYRAYLKDSDDTINAGQSAMHYQQYQELIGAITQSDSAVSPNN